MRILVLTAAALSGVLASAAPARPSLPFHFEANRGQAGPDARFVGRSAGAAAVLEETGVAIRVAGDAEPIRIRFGARAMPHGTEPTGGESNYLIGSDRSRWRTHIAHYRRVRYRNLYPGVDLVFYGSGGDLEFDFALQPGADPASIRLQITGGAGLKLSPGGELELGGGMKLARPVMYQPGPGSRRAVSGGFQLDGDTVKFAVGSYDRSLPLIIDPILLYTSYWGGLANDTVTGMATDSSGNIYITGYTNSASLTTTPGAYKRTLNAGDADAFVAKLNSTATAVVYSTFLGGGSADYGRAIAVDAAGAAYITGASIGNLPVTANAFRASPVNTPAIFAAKLSPTGATLDYATYLGGAGAGLGIAVDSSGNAWIAGYTVTPSFPTTPDLQPVFSGGSDGFLMKLNPAGSAALFSSFLGGRGEDQATSVTVDTGGNAYVAGYTAGQGFPVSGGAYQNTLAGATDAFVVKITAAGGVSYSTFLGGTGDDRAHAVAIDSSGNVYLGGQTASSNYPVSTGAFQTVHAGGTWDGFVTKMNSTATAVVYSTLLGGSGGCAVADLVRSNLCDSVYGVAIDSNGTAYLAGVAGAGFPTAGAQQSTAGGSGDGFAAQLSANGTRLLYSTFVGGSAADLLSSAALASGVPVMGGLTASTNVPVSSGALRAANPGGYDGILVRLGACTVTLGSTTSFFPNTAGNYTFDVLAPSNCSWSASSSATWITFTGASGTGNGQVRFSLAANSGIHRTGLIDLGGGAVYTVEQITGACIQLGYYGSWFPASGGTYSIPVFATCNWTATANQSWITISSGSGTANGQVGYSLSANATGAARFGQIDVNGLKFDVNQVGGAGPLSCSYELSRLQDSFDRTGGSSSLLVISQTGCEWTVVNPHSWITITAGPAGRGDGIVGYTVDRNRTGSPRVGQITIGGVTVAISQSD